MCVLGVFFLSGDSFVCVKVSFAFLLVVISLLVSNIAVSSLERLICVINCNVLSVELELKPFLTHLCIICYETHHTYYAISMSDDVWCDVMVVM